MRSGEYAAIDRAYQDRQTISGPDNAYMARFPANGSVGVRRRVEMSRGNNMRTVYLIEPATLAGQWQNQQIVASQGRTRDDFFRGWLIGRDPVIHQQCPGATTLSASENPSVAEPPNR